MKGYFIGDVAVRWLKDGRKMKLLEDFAFVDSRRKKWLAPKGSIIDGASIPRMLWAVTGSPFVGSYRRASVLHDVACTVRKRAYRRVHKMFYEAMLAGGTPKRQAEQMYLAVSVFGPKWKVGK